MEDALLAYRSSVISLSVANSASKKINKHRQLYRRKKRAKKKEVPAGNIPTK